MIVLIVNVLDAFFFLFCVYYKYRKIMHFFCQLIIKEKEICLYLYLVFFFFCILLIIINIGNIYKNKKMYINKSIAI